jgi:hypothetical protein
VRQSLCILWLVFLQHTWAAVRYHLSPPDYADWVLQADDIEDMMNEERPQAGVDYVASAEELDHEMPACPEPDFTLLQARVEHMLDAYSLPAREWSKFQRQKAVQSGEETAGWEQASGKRLTNCLKVFVYIKCCVQSKIL